MSILGKLMYKTERYVYVHHTGGFPDDMLFMCMTHEAYEKAKGTFKVTAFLDTNVEKTLEDLEDFEDWKFSGDLPKSLKKETVLDCLEDFKQYVLPKVKGYDTLYTCVVREDDFSKGILLKDDDFSKGILLKDEAGYDMEAVVRIPSILEETVSFPKRGKSLKFADYIKKCCIGDNKGYFILQICTDNIAGNTVLVRARKADYSDEVLEQINKDLALEPSRVINLPSEEYMYL